MTAVVTFTLLPIDRLEAAAAAAEAGTLAAFLKQEGKTAAQFAGDGGIYGPVFAYLDEVHEINVSSSDHDEPGPDARSLHAARCTSTSVASPAMAFAAPPSGGSSGRSSRVDRTYNTVAAQTSAMEIKKCSATTE